MQSEDQQQDIAIEVNHVSKTFKIPRDRKSTIKDNFIGIFRRTDYNEYHALQDINFEVKKGEFLGIVGRNGSGKSTLLKIIASIYLPDSGDVKLHGSLVPFLELGVGFNSELTGKENVFLNGTILGMTRKAIAAKYHDIVEFAELKDFMDLQLKHYSSGMQVRLAFSVAIQTNADIFILDEILAVGDAGFQQKSGEKIKEMKAAGKTVIFVSHDMGAISQHCDRVILIDDHKIKSIGRPDEVVSDYRQLFSQPV